MATNIYFEARGEPIRGQIAVRDITINRGSAVCSNVFAKGQFSWTRTKPWKTVESFLLDKPRLNAKDSKAWKLAKEVAVSEVRVLSKEYRHYHSLGVDPPWTKGGIVIGNHKFMKGVK